MKRVLYTLHDNNKYVLRKEYESFGIYQQKTPTGYYISQSYAIVGDGNIIVVESYNNICLDEIYDMIDNYKESGKFGIRAMKKLDDTYIMHFRGNHEI